MADVIMVLVFLLCNLFIGEACLKQFIYKNRRTSIRGEIRTWISPKFVRTRDDK